MSIIPILRHKSDHSNSERETDQHNEIRHLSLSVVPVAVEILRQRTASGAPRE